MAVSHPFLLGGGVMGAMMRSHDWSESALGDPDTWPRSLSSVVSLLLASKFPMFLAWGPDLGMLYNDSYAELLGAKHPEALGQRFEDVWSEIWSDVSPLANAAMAGEATYFEDLPLLMNRNGFDEQTWFTFSYSPIRDGAGAVGGMFCAAHETTQKVLTERRLAFRIRLDDALRDLGDPRTIFATAAELLGVELAADRTGYVEVGADGETFVFAQDWKRGDMPSLAGRHRLDTFGAELIAALRSGRTLVFEDARLEPMMTHDGTAALDAMKTRAVITVPLVKAGRLAASLYVHCREPRRWTNEDMGLVREVAERSWSAIERARAEEAQRAGERELRMIADALPVLIAFIDNSQTYRFANSAYEDWFGMPASQVIGRKTYDLFDRHAYELRLHFMEKALAGQEVRFELAWPHPDGRNRIADINYLPRFSDAGEVEGYYVFVLDITDRTEAADALRSLNETLESRVTQAVTERREFEETLRQSQKLEAVGQLTGGVAHDFNNLLTVIRSSVDLLARPDLPEERRRRYIGAISDTVTRAAKLTGQLLAFARRQALKPEVFNVGQSVASVCDMVATLTGSRIQIVTRVPDEPCFIDADPSQFDTALVNMAVNARDAMDGAGRLTVTVNPVSVIPAIRSHPAIHAEFVALCVEDTGTGIAPDILERVFEPFFTTKEVGQGTGLGLSQVFGFAKQSGGEIRVESEVGKGTTFILYLPRVAAKPAAIDNEPGKLIDGHGSRVLLVEDNIEVGNFATQTLDELGYKTVRATNGEEALSELDKAPDGFDVVFSDVVMPGMNGIELAQAIRRLNQSLPVVLTSGYSHILAQSGSSGFELLHKPYSIEELSRTLSKVISRQRLKSDH